MTSFLNLFSNNKKKGKDKLFEFKKLENLKRADWKDDKQKFKANVTLGLGLSIPSLNLEGLFDDGDSDVKIEKKEGGQWRSGPKSN